MRIVSILENQKIEKRIAITPDIAKKYIALGFKISIVEKYGEHLGFKDSDYKKLGVEISTNKSEILNDLKTKGYYAIESFITPEVIKEIENDVTKNRYSLNENIQNVHSLMTRYHSDSSVRTRISFYPTLL